MAISWNIAMKQLSLTKQGKLFYEINPSNKPVLTIEPGETVIVETQDSASGLIRNEASTDFNIASARVPQGTSNPLSGPIFIKGTDKGDTIAVEIKEIKPSIGQGYTSVFGLDWLLGETSTSRFLNIKIPPERTLRKICPIKNGKIYWSDEIILPFKPMIGEIATSPPTIMPNPGVHGGNMDLPEICTGNKIYLPAFVPGGLLYIGDAHAAQGDGELSGCAIEMPAEVTLTINLIKDKTIKWPRIESTEYIGCVATSGRFGTDLRDAVRIAFMELILWLEREYGFNRWNAYQLCTQVARVRLGNITCVAVKFPKRYL